MSDIVDSFKPSVEQVEVHCFRGQLHDVQRLLMRTDQLNVSSLSIEEKRASSALLPQKGELIRHILPVYGSERETFAGAQIVVVKYTHLQLLEHKAFRSSMAEFRG